MLTQQQRDVIEAKGNDTPIALQRNKGVDYTEGYFFITLNTRNEVPVLSTVEGRVGVTLDHPDAPHIRYSELGQKVLEVWQSIPQFHPQVETIAAEAMPEHFHGLLHIKSNGREHLGRIVNGFMIGCTHAYWDILGIPWRTMHRDTSMGKSAITQETTRKWQDVGHTHSFRGPALFVHGYNDVIPITQEDIQTKIDYIHTQAERRLIKGVNAPCFRIHRHQHSAHWSKETALAAIANDVFFRTDITACQTAQQKVTERLLDGLDWLGDKQILLSNKKFPLVSHHADIHLFEKQKGIVLSTARKGAVIVSAFVSPQEREIRDLLFMEQCPVIEIMSNGFSDRYKPYGKAFYNCAENKLAQITPWNYIYRIDAKISREMCLVMNELSRAICQCKKSHFIVKSLVD